MEIYFLLLCIICLLLLLLTFYLAVKRRRRDRQRDREQMNTTGVEYIYSQQPDVVIDLEYPLIHQQQRPQNNHQPPPPSFDKPESPSLPPPSYQDYRKDIRIAHGSQQ
ncbi:unnamed protein product [Cunninghamella blakesleeana]